MMDGGCCWFVTEMPIEDHLYTEDRGRWWAHSNKAHDLSAFIDKDIDGFDVPLRGGAAWRRFFSGLPGEYASFPGDSRQLVEDIGSALGRVVFTHAGHLRRLQVGQSGGLSAIQYYRAQRESTIGGYIDVVWKYLPLGYWSWEGAAESGQAVGDVDLFRVIDGGLNDTREDIEARTLGFDNFEEWKASDHFSMWLASDANTENLSGSEVEPEYRHRRIFLPSLAFGGKIRRIIWLWTENAEMALQLAFDVDRTPADNVGAKPQDGGSRYSVLFYDSTSQLTQTPAVLLERQETREHAAAPHSSVPEYLSSMNNILDWLEVLPGGQLRSVAFYLWGNEVATQVAGQSFNLDFNAGVVSFGVPLSLPPRTDGNRVNYLYSMMMSGWIPVQEYAPPTAMQEFGILPRSYGLHQVVTDSEFTAGSQLLDESFEDAAAAPQTPEVTMDKWFGNEPVPTWPSVVSIADDTVLSGTEVLFIRENPPVMEDLVLLAPDQNSWRSCRSRGSAIEDYSTNRNASSMSRLRAGPHRFYVPDGSNRWDFEWMVSVLCSTNPGTYDGEPGNVLGYIDGWSYGKSYTQSGASLSGNRISRTASGSWSSTSTEVTDVYRAVFWQRVTSGLDFPFGLVCIGKGQVEMKYRVTSGSGELSRNPHSLRATHETVLEPSNQLAIVDFGWHTVGRSAGIPSNV